MKKNKAVVLLSGGVDSSTTLAVAKSQGYEIVALSFDYGQRHRYELNAARKIAAKVGVTEYIVIEIDLRQIGGSALTADIHVPKSRSADEIKGGIPVTYVPARNTIFLSYALALAEVKRASRIFIGANAIDYSGYPDCRTKFIEAFEKMANLATKSAVAGNRIGIEAPLINLTKAEIIKKGIELGLDYSLTFSCYDPDENGFACGACDSCLIRRKGFAEAGIPDPTNYMSRSKVSK